ncbi:HK97 family phage portal protein [Actinotalea ferrariae CF5-4]|uniref:HK97 family phage portal protein n=1 Tax=Actinotalea ferrariae CF5-4 TaxID=948458 RepID=A0A021VZZ6_9CELL|nr:phage portal protein [Actinotalea ferrariae]EYR64647.1 HK97 family phage portal protein [Actinotalea ferrariae CF5-4]
MRALSALSGLVSRNLENPSTALTSGRLLSQLDSPDELWSNGKVGDPLQIGAVLRCVQVLASGVAGCPLRVHDRATMDPVTIPVLVAERAGQTPFELWETTVAHLALWGNAYLRKVRARDGRIVELVPIHPSRVLVEVDVDAGLAIGMPYAKKFTVDGKVPLTERDILHIPNFSTDGIMGVSVIGRMRRMFGLATNAEQLAERMYERGMLQSGFLSTDKELNEERSAILKDRWRAKLAGLDNAYEIAVLDNGTKFHQLSMSPADAQFLETRKFQTTEIARLFGLPGWIINDQEKSTSWGTGMEQQFVALVVITLKPYFQRIEQRVTREIADPRAEKAEFKVEGLLRGDSKARAAFYASGITHGWMVPNDVRPLEDMKPVPWGDEPYRPHTQSATATDDTTSGDDDDDDADA